MKHLAIFLSTTSLAFSAAAQTARPHGPAAALKLPQGRLPIASHIIREQFDGAAPAAKTTAQIQRLIATSSNNFFSPGVDSQRYYYGSQTRGAAHNPKNPDSYSEYFSPIAEQYLNLDGTVYGRTQYVKPDSVRGFDQSGYDRIQRFTYNAAHQATTVLRDLTFYRERFDLYYNAAGDNVRCDEFNDTTSGAPIPGYALTTTQHSTFDVQHRLLTDSMADAVGGIAPSRKLLWTYGTGGRIASVLEQEWNGSAWMPYERAIAAYLTNGLLQRVVYESWDGSAWQPQASDSFAYNGANPSYTYYGSSYYNSDSGRMVLGYYTMFQLNAAGNWDTGRSYFLNLNQSGYTEIFRSVIRYNSYQNWERNVQYEDLDGDGIIDMVPAFETKYYYELYDPTSLADAAVVSNFSASPNPTSDRLNIRWGKSTAPARYILTDLNGRTLVAGSIAANAVQMELGLRDYAPGLYLLTMVDETGAVLHREKVVRR